MSDDFPEWINQLPSIPPEGSRSELPEEIPASVRAMADDPQAPTAPLDDFMIAMARDDNWWWRVGCGHHLNLFEEAVQRIPGFGGD